MFALLISCDSARLCLLRCTRCFCQCLRVTFHFLSLHGKLEVTANILSWETEDDGITSCALQNLESFKLSTAITKGLGTGCSESKVNPSAGCAYVFSDLQVQKKNRKLCLKRVKGI